MRRVIVPVSIIFILSLAREAEAVPRVWGVWNWGIAEPVHVMVRPAGIGDPLTAARTQSGTAVDATIRIQLWADGNDNPELPPDPQFVPNFPREDIWLEVPGMSACVGGAIADANTDETGWFTFSGPPAMGGANDPAVGTSYPYVMVNGSPLEDQDGPFIRPSIVFNSPDINGDLSVDLSDVPPFAADFSGPYDFRSDLNWSGRIDLSDVVLLAHSLGDDCAAP